MIISVVAMVVTVLSARAAAAIPFVRLAPIAASSATPVSAQSVSTPEKSPAPRRAAAPAAGIVPAIQRPIDSATSNSGDYATDAFGDAWDFNNPEDLTPLSAGMSVGISGLHIGRTSPTNSVLAGTVGPSSYLVLAEGWAHILPWGRDSGTYPINANRYTQLTLSMFSSADMGMGAFYQVCLQGPLASCYNGSPMQALAGWHTYTLDLSTATTYYKSGPRWSGQAFMLRLGMNPPKQTNFQIDWIRLGTPGTVGLNPDQPQPSIISPSNVGGADYATTVRGRPWNLQAPGDVQLIGTGNATYSAAGVRAVNVKTPTIPGGNDPHLQLPLPVPIDGSKYNQMTVRVCYDGKFSLSGSPGGGMNGRIIWQIAGENFQRNGQDFLVFPGCQTIDLDLSAPASVVEDEADLQDPGGQRGFAGHSIVSLRFDPDEDPGPRYFSVSSIRLTTATTAAGGFPITFADRNWHAGTVADIWLDGTGSGTGMRQIARSVPVTAGENTFAWLGRDISNAVVTGSYYLAVRLSNSAAHTLVYASTRILIGAPAALPGAVVGVQATAGKGMVNVSWSPPTSGGPPLAYVVRASNGVNQTVGPSARSVTMGGLSDGTAYSFSVAAANGSGVTAPYGSVRAVPAAAAGTYVPLPTPQRLLDTRTRAPVGPGGSLDVQVTGAVPGVPSSGVSAVAVNVTAVGSTSDGYLTVWPSGQTRPATSSLNFDRSIDVANMVVARLGAGGRISIFNSGGATNVLVDVVGYYSDGRTTGATYFPMSPHRVLDTRNGTGARQARVGPGGSIAVQLTGVAGIPSSGVSAVVLNVAGVVPSVGGYLTVWPAGIARPTVSSLNLRPGDTRANLVTVRVGTGGKIVLYNSVGTVDLIADVVGWFGTAGNLSGASLLPLTPYRIFDTRPQSFTSLPPSALSTQVPMTVNLTGQGSGVLVGTAKAVLANVTSVDANSSGYVTVWPTGETQPAASTINLRAGENRPNLVAERLPASGDAQLAVNVGSTDVVVDVVAWYG